MIRINQESTNPVGLPLFMTRHYNSFCDEVNKVKSTVKKVSFGKFEVYTEDKSEPILVSFGNQRTFPSCTCDEWNNNALPCQHMFQVFKEFDLSFNDLSPLYRSNPCFKIDDSCINVFGYTIEIRDKATQCDIPSTSTQSIEDDTKTTRPSIKRKSDHKEKSASKKTKKSNRKKSTSSNSSKSDQRKKLTNQNANENDQTNEMPSEGLLKLFNPCNSIQDGNTTHTNPSNKQTNSSACQITQSDIESLIHDPAQLNPNETDIHQIHHQPKVKVPHKLINQAIQFSNQLQISRQKLSNQSESQNELNNRIPCVSQLPQPITSYFIQSIETFQNFDESAHVNQSRSAPPIVKQSSHPSPKLVQQEQPKETDVLILSTHQNVPNQYSTSSLTSSSTIDSQSNCLPTISDNNKMSSTHFLKEAPVVSLVQQPIANSIKQHQNTPKKERKRKQTPSRISRKRKSEVKQQQESVKIDKKEKNEKAQVKKPQLTFRPNISKISMKSYPAFVGQPSIHLSLTQLLKRNEESLSQPEIKIEPEDFLDVDIDIDSVLNTETEELADESNTNNPVEESLDKISKLKEQLDASLRSELNLINDV